MYKTTIEMANNKDLRAWEGQRVVILGAARQGTALARYLSRHGAQVVLNDRRSQEELAAAREALADQNTKHGASIEWVCGGHPLELLDGADLLCVSGGVPLTLPIVTEAVARGIPLSNDSQIFLEVAPCPVIGITGSAGKTTTTSLVGAMAEAALRQDAEKLDFQRVWVGGNIGSPLISVVDEMQPADLAVMELSSFQLELMTKSPQIAAVLNVTPNHLDRHGTMQAYTAAKARILHFQETEDWAILNRDDTHAWRLTTAVKGKLASFGQEEPAFVPGTFVRSGEVIYKDQHQVVRLFPQDVIQLRGEHNLLNVLAACAIAITAGIPPDAIRLAVEQFSGVPHRLEFIREWGGAAWYNDSIATAPERTMAAVQSFDEPLILLVGGRDKDLPWEAFAALAHQRVERLIVFGEAAAKILPAVEAQRAPGATRKQMVIRRCANLKEAVAVAAQLVKPGAVVLLSPGGTSFDEFRDFEERGQCFRQLVMQL